VWPLQCSTTVPLNEWILHQPWSDVAGMLIFYFRHAKDRLLPCWKRNLNSKFWHQVVEEFIKSVTTNHLPAIRLAIEVFIIISKCEYGFFCNITRCFLIIQAGRADQAHFHSHSIKGSSATIGWNGVSQEAKVLLFYYLISRKFNIKKDNSNSFSISIEGQKLKRMLNVRKYLICLWNRCWTILQERVTWMGRLK
jgi:hypothetical protein